MTIFILAYLTLCSLHYGGENSEIVYITILSWQQALVAEIPENTVNIVGLMVTQVRAHGHHYTGTW